jgi:hypothetical protein
MKKNEMGGTCSAYGDRKGLFRVWGEPEEKRALGIPMRRWEDNINMDLQKVGCGGTDWIELAQDRGRWRAVVTAEINLRVPYNAGNFLADLKPVSFSTRTLLHGVSK